MNNKLLIIGMSLVLLFVGPSGCTQTQQNDTGAKMSWEVIDCTRTTELFEWECEWMGQKGICESSGISEVSITIWNTGDERTTFIVDFQFKLTELTPGLTVWDSDKCPCDRIRSYTNSVYEQEQISIGPGDSRTVSASTDPNPGGNMRVGSWCYEVNPE